MGKYYLTKRQCDVEKCGSFNVWENDWVDNHAFGCPTKYTDYTCAECGRLVGTSGLFIQKASLEEFREKVKYIRKKYIRKYKKSK
tara:strand:+ start:1394 stop:1648 length:255 start_codon:yes stop_codon:yes gene_type:complete